MLDTEQIQTFENDGYLVVRSLINLDDLMQLRSEYNKVISGELTVPVWGDDHVSGKVVQLANPSQHLKHWQRHSYFINALAVARQLMGDDVQYGYDQIIMKPAYWDAPTHWHQDAGYWKKPGANTRGITCWLAIYDVPVESGCMQFIPGSHKGELQQHFSVADRSEINSALATTVDESLAVPAPLRAGDASFHHCRTLHYTSGNQTDKPRCGLITHFYPPS